MMDHYSHVRRTAKRQVTDQLAGGLMDLEPAKRQEQQQVSSEKAN
jgi:hypothetical protein